MKGYESQYDQSLDPDLPVIIRLDGNRFSKLTKKLKLNKPFDERMHKWMVYASKSLWELCYPHSVFLYSQSDEVTIILMKRNEQSDNFHSNRIQKLTSLLAARFSSAFNAAMSLDLVGDDASRPYKSLLDMPVAIFDARVFSVKEDELVNTIIWRQDDGFRNSVSMFFRSVYEKKHGKNSAIKREFGVNTLEKIDILKNEFGISYHNDLDIKYQNGFCMYMDSNKYPISSIMDVDKFNFLKSSGKISGDEMVSRNELVECYDMPKIKENKSFLENILNKLS